ncbi:hypothetical protein VR46_19045 [Streptomyces sp. NRRL S-444]|nr:hypothetical protein VR46_19045 [Streptomyces sp. NRRL S-444]
MTLYARHTGLSSPVGEERLPRDRDDHDGRHRGRAGAAPGEHVEDRGPALLSQASADEFTSFWAAEASMMWRYAASRFSAHDADDLVSETMIVMAAKWDDLAARGVRPRPYAYGVLKLKALKFVRHRASEPLLPDPAEEAVPGVEHAASAERIAVANIEFHNIMALLRSALTDRERRIFVMAHLHDMSTRQIAEALDTEPHNVRKSLYRSNHKLRGRLEDRRC